VSLSSRNSNSPGASIQIERAADARRDPLGKFLLSASRAVVLRLARTDRKASDEEKGSGGRAASCRRQERIPHGFERSGSKPIEVLNAHSALKSETLVRELDLSVLDLSSAANISAGMLSKIENGQISPSLSTLQSIANALAIPLSLLFAASEERRDCSFVRDKQGVVIERRGTKGGSRSISCSDM